MIAAAEPMGPRFVQFLSGTTLLRGAPAEVVAALAEQVRVQELRTGEVLIRQGDPGDGLYVLVDGRLEARLRSEAGAERVIGVMRRGDVVGEMAVITGSARSCSVVAVRESRVLALDRSAFVSVLARFPQAHANIASQVIARVSAREVTRVRASTVALVPLSEAAARRVPLLGQSLTKALARFGRVAHIEQGWSGIAPSSTAIGANLAVEEKAHDLVLYGAEVATTPWSRRCIQQADLVLLVGDADGEPAPSELERSWLWCSQPITAGRVELVLLHADRAKAPAGTARWLDPRRVAMHHHVVEREPRDVERLARFITGRAVNVVLSGGGSRGFAHVGVLRAMLEADIPIDFLAGTSIGAAIAAMFAMEWDGPKVRDGVLGWVPRVLDHTLPVLSVIAGRRGTRRFRELLGERAIEDLWINYFAISADLAAAEEYVHQRGPLWRAVRTSVSLPGILPPMFTDGRWLVDGGVLNNLPIDVMQSLTEGLIVAVDVSQEHAFDFDTEPPSESGWRLLLHRLSPFRRRKRLPNIGDVVMRSSEMAALRISRTTRERVPVALSLAPPVGGFRMLDFDQASAIIESGYEYGRANVEAWKAQLGLAAGREPPDAPPRG